MGAKFIQDGRFIDYTPSADVALGAVVVQGNLVGVAHRPISANTLGSLAVEGVFEFPKASGNGTALAAGTGVYWQADPGVATASANDGEDPPTAYPLLGKTVRAAVDADATVRVRLSQ